MSDKKNQLWRLDVLESHFLEKPVRFPRTKSILRVKGKNKANLLPSSKDQALQEIAALQADIFAKKLHSSLVKYNRVVKKTIKSSMADKKLKEDEKVFLKSLNVEQISSVRIIKLVSTIYKLNAKRLLEDPKTAPGFLPQWIIDGLVNKSDELNPSRFYNELSNVERNWYSKLMNHKDVQAVVDVVENSFKIVLGPVQKTDDIEDVETSESESEEEEDDQGQVADSEDSDNEGDSEQQEIDDDDFSAYDKFLAGTDEEEEEEDHELRLDPTIDYNQVTDEEPSDDEEEEQDSEPSINKKKGSKISSVSTTTDVDDFFDFEADEKPKKEKKTKEDKKKEKVDKKKKVSLPELQSGYISASDGSDFEDDKMVEEITGGQKKNRRGQRARQKIWEQKFGRGANHMKKEKEEKQKMREQKQREWEEREAKRQAKAADMTGANSSKLGARKPISGDGKAVAPLVSSTPGLHPSWEAKKKQDAALKNVKFQGKKVVF